MGSGVEFVTIVPEMHDFFIECLPRGICSWNFDLRESGSVIAATEGDFFNETGRIDVGGQAFSVEKKNPFSGEWDLVKTGTVLLRAKKESAFSRTISVGAVSAGGSDFTLHAASALTREMLLTGERMDCRIRPEHAFTRRATIQGRADSLVPVLFGFWLSVILWRRAANNSNS